MGQGVSRFCVIFHNPDKTYYAGEVVTGRVELVLEANKIIRGVQLKLEGRAKCSWTELEYGPDWRGKFSVHNVSYNETEVYLNKKQFLIGTKIDKFELPMGKHVYPFAVMLPVTSPPSFCGSYGDISYYAQAEIDIPMALNATSEKFGFTVVNRLNLNLYPHLRNPYSNETSKTFCCFCCASGPLTIVVLLPKTGFVPSESIPITLEVDNASDVTVNAVHVNLNRKIHWKSEGKHKYENEKIYEFLRLGGVKQGQSHTWSENFTIPSSSFPYLGCCSIIKIDYELHIKAVSSPGTGLDMEIPITIGDIPLTPLVTSPRQTNQNMRHNPTGAPVNSPGFTHGQSGRQPKVEKSQRLQIFTTD